MSVRRVKDKQGNYIHLEASVSDKNTGTKKWKRMCRYFWVKRVVTNLTTKHVLLVVEYIQAGVYLEFELNRSDISTMAIERILLEHGIDISSEYSWYIRQVFFKSEKTAVHTYTYSKIGWHHFFDEVDFLLGTPMVNKKEDVSITYGGDFNFKTKGTFEGWKADFEPVLRDNHYMATIVVSALTSILIGYFNIVQPDTNNKLIDIDTLVVSLVGETSKGKSISAQLCAGLFSTPYKSDNSLFSTTNMTNNYAVNMLDGNHGVLQIFDDISSTKSLKEYADLVYMLSQNQGRGRATKGYGGNKERNSWSTLVLTTTEYTLQLLEDNRKGKFVRNIEFDFPYFTKSPEEADDIKSKLDTNFGVVAELFAKAVSDIDNSVLLDLYYSNRDVLGQATGAKDGLSDRIINNLACILTSAAIANVDLGIEINIEEIISILAKVHDDGVESRTEKLSALEFVQEFVVKKSSNFINIPPPNGEVNVYNNGNRSTILGNVIKHNGSKFTEIQFIATELKKLLIDNGYVNVLSIFKEWKNDGLLLHERGKNTKKCSIKGHSVHCVVLRIPLPTVKFKSF